MEPMKNDNGYEMLTDIDGLWMTNIEGDWRKSETISKII